MKALIKTLSIIAIACLPFYSCVKKTQELDSDTSSASENFTATSAANDMGSIADEAGRTKNVSSFKTSGEMAILSSCATLTFDSAAVSTITINFGATNCVCNDGRSRRGSLIVTYTGKYKDSLTTITITPKDYFVDNNGVSGSKTVKNLGHNTLGHLVYDITENISITKADNSGTITMDSKRTREWMTGENTLVWSDDKYSITGNASGKNANGRSYTSNITKPLVRDMSIGCRKHFISGTIEHTPANKPKRVIDFGDGTCDDIATVKINGTTYTITLK